MEFGKYVVLSTAHIRYATAELLNAWALLAPTEQPLAVASTHYGWFLSARPVESATQDQLPDELVGILALGREHQCDYVLLDCDGNRSEALPVFPW